MRVGDVLGSCVLLLTCCYLGLAGSHFAGLFNLSAFGKNWAADGFCISNKGTAFDSHLLCVYTDTLWAVIIFLAARSEQARPEVSGPLMETAPSVFMHGMAHGLLWYQGTHYGGLGTVQVIYTFSTTIEKAIAYGVIIAFYFAFVHNQLSSSWFVSLLQAIFHAVATNAYCPPKFVFTYVNTVIFFNTTGSRMLGLKGPKDIFYDLRMGFAAFVMFFTWFEPLACDAFLINWGGHAWFDNSITVGTFVYYLAARALPPRKGSGVHANKVK
eukprot:CAMPEP_0185283870 /NCGR_PEP_ID=MMETSP1363-20130426/733_1 /TAXON_ID=38817 /ORGANISM="Gephyrocapsa oceanica, Strain RCC1303" /LENGTH=269 /DNA_ID=CAMNT_0027879545 /DNA_START=44 /DNA_END=853 /DNA_ORIENTATION=-